eukprot:2364850-Rhodomonas_salina.1
MFCVVQPPGTTTEDEVSTGQESQHVCGSSTHQLRKLSTRHERAVSGTARRPFLEDLPGDFRGWWGTCELRVARKDERGVICESEGVKCCVQGA